MMVTPYCTECGTALGTGARFCGNCGSGTVASRGSGTVANPSRFAAKSQVCPRCGQSDKVAKASGIVDVGFRREERWRDPRSGSEIIVTSTPLAARLKLPEPSRERPPTQIESVIMTGLATIGICAAVLFFNFWLSGMASMISGLLLDLDMFHDSIERRLRLIFFSLVAVEAIIAIVVYASRVTQRPGLRRNFNAQVRRWSKRKLVWDKLYYCYRDDCVFVDGLSAPSARMLEFLDKKRDI